MANTVFRFYADRPAAIWRWLADKGQDAVVRQHARAIFRGRAWLVILVFDQEEVAEQFRAWLREQDKAEWSLRTADDVMLDQPDPESVELCGKPVSLSLAKFKRRRHQRSRQHRT